MTANRRALVAAVQMVSTGDVARNLAAAARLIGAAAAAGAELVLLPEAFAALEDAAASRHGEIDQAPDGAQPSPVSLAKSPCRRIRAPGTRGGEMPALPGTDSIGGEAPALRGTDGAGAGEAPALRGTDSAGGGEAPALRGKDGGIGGEMPALRGTDGAGGGEAPALRREPAAGSRESAPLQAFLASQALAHGLTLVGGTIPLASRPGRTPDAADFLVPDGRARAACLVYGPSGERLARYDKMHLFDVQVNDSHGNYSESRHYEPGDMPVWVNTAVGKVGLSVCYDLRFPEYYRQLFRAGAEALTVPAAFTKVTGAAHWDTLLRARAIENQCYVIAAAQGGRHSAKRETWGHSMIIDPWGDILALHEEGEGLAVAELDLGRVAELRTRMPIAAHVRLPLG